MGRTVRRAALGRLRIHQVSADTLRRFVQRLDIMIRVGRQHVVHDIVGDVVEPSLRVAGLLGYRPLVVQQLLITCQACRHQNTLLTW